MKSEWNYQALRCNNDNCSLIIITWKAKNDMHQSKRNPAIHHWEPWPSDATAGAKARQGTWCVTTLRQVHNKMASQPWGASQQAGGFPAKLLPSKQVASQPKCFRWLPSQGASQQVASQPEWSQKQMTTSSNATLQQAQNDIMQHIWNKSCHTSLKALTVGKGTPRYLMHDPPPPWVFPDKAASQPYTNNRPQQNGLPGKVLASRWLPSQNETIKHWDANRSSDMSLKHNIKSKHATQSKRNKPSCHASVRAGPRLLNTASMGKGFAWWATPPHPQSSQTRWLPSPNNSPNKMASQPNRCFPAGGLPARWLPSQSASQHIGGFPAKMLSGFPAKLLPSTWLPSQCLNQKRFCTDLGQTSGIKLPSQCQAHLNEHNNVCSKPVVHSK